MDRSAKFRSLASGRTIKVLQALDVLGRLAASDRHEWSDGDVKAIFGAIRDRVERAEGLFKAAKVEFRLP